MADDSDNDIFGEMILKQTFIAETWDETGETGFRPEQCTNAFNPINYPFGLAHDFLEHAGDFTIKGEIKAHATMYWLRYLTGFHIKSWRPMDLNDIASEWINLYHGICQEGCLNPCSPQKKLEDEAEEDLKTIITSGKKLLVEEIGREYLDKTIYNQLSQNFADWFRLAYREAEERYPNRHKTCDVFQEITNKFEELFRDEIFEGQKVIISLNLKTGILEFQKLIECIGCGVLLEENYYCDSCE